MDNRQLRIRDLKLNEDYDNVFYRGVNLRENKRKEIPTNAWSFEREKNRYNEGYRVSSVKMDDPKTTKFLESLNFKSRYIGGFQNEEEEDTSLREARLPRVKRAIREDITSRVEMPMKEAYNLVSYNRDKHVYESQFKPLTEKAKDVWTKIVENNSLKEFEELIDRKFKEGALSERSLNRYLENNSEFLIEKLNLKSFKEKRVKPLNEGAEIIRRKTPDDPWGLLGGDKLNKRKTTIEDDSLTESEEIHGRNTERELYPEDPWNLLPKLGKKDMGLKEAHKNRRRFFDRHPGLTSDEKEKLISLYSLNYVPDNIIDWNDIDSYSYEELYDIVDSFIKHRKDMGLKEARDDKEDTHRRVDLDDPWGLYKKGIISRDSIE